MAKKTTERLSEVILKFDVDDENALTRVQAFQNAEKAAFQEIKTVADQYTSAMMDVANVQNEVARAANRSSDAVETAARTTRQAQKTVEDYGDAYRRASEQVESFGDVATNISQVSGLFRGVGAGGVADVAMLGADITDAVEGIRRLGPAIGDVSSKALTAVNSITGLDLSMGQLALTGAGVGIAIAAITAALAALVQSANEAGEEARRLAEIRANAIIETEGEITDMTLNDYETRRRELQTTIDESATAYERLRQQVLEQAQALVDERGTGPLIGGFADVMDSLEDVDYMLNHVSISIDRNLDPSLSSAVSYIEQLEEGLNQARDASATATASLTELNHEYAQSEILTNTLAQRERELAQGRNEAGLRAIQTEIDLQNQLMSTTSEQLEQRRQQIELERAAIQGGRGGLTGSALAEADAQFARLGRELATINNELLPAVQAREAEEAAIRAGADAALEALDSERELAGVRDEITSINERAAQQEQTAIAATDQKIEQLTAKFDEFVGNANRQITEAENEARAERETIDREYMQDTRKAWREYYKKEKETLQDQSLDRLRLIQDAGDAMLQAEESNDVIAFIRAKRQGQRDLERFDQDAGIETQRRAEQFKSEQEERDNERKQQLADLRTATKDRINEIRQGIDKQRDLLRQQIDAERAALQQRLNDLRTALNAEIQARQQAFKQSLIQEQQYAQQRLAIEQQMNAALASVAQSAYSRAITSLSGASGGTASAAGMSSGTRLFGTTFNFSNIQVGSDISRTEVQNSLRLFGHQLVQSKKTALKADK